MVPRAFPILLILASGALAQLDEAKIIADLRAAPKRRTAWRRLEKAEQPDVALAIWRHLPEDVRGTWRYWRAGEILSDRLGEYPLGLRAAAALLKIAIETKNDTRAGGAYRRLGRRHARFGATESARQAFVSAKAHYDRAGQSPPGLTREIRVVATPNQRVTPDREFIAAQVEKALATLNRSDAAMTRLRGLAFEAYYLREWRLGYRCYARILEVRSQVTGRPRDRADDLNGASRFALELGWRSSGPERKRLLDHAAEWATEALRLHGDNTMPEMVLRDHCVLSSTHLARGAYALAEQHFKSEMNLIDEQRSHVGGDLPLRVFHAQRHHVYDDYALFRARRAPDSDALRDALRISEMARVGALREARRFRGRDGPAWMDAPVAFDALEKRIRETRTLVLVYLVGSFDAGVVAIGPDGLSFHALGSIGAIEDAARQFSDVVYDTGSARVDIETAGTAAWQALLGPAAKQLSSADRVIVIGSGHWPRLPFAALVRPGNEPLESRYVAARHAVAHAPSIGSLLVPTRPGTIRSVLAMGHPGPADHDPDLAQRYGLATLPPLTRVATEVKNTGATVPGSRAYVGADATEAVYREFAPQADLVHVAAHALADDKNGARSTLVLQPAGDGDGLLTLAELASIPLTARCVILSGCRTAVGRELAGEGIRGLARALIACGADTVLVARAPLNDQMAPRFLAPFVSTIVTGKEDLPGALQRAQRSLLAKRFSAHPALWAPLVLIGQGELLR
ncbi:MAG: hypothetical protein CMJ83_00930 [Planctomycetes bacterium]|nr:hypothetical protein [Planctomycetota bacterium]